MKIFKAQCYSYQLVKWGWSIKCHINSSYVVYLMAVINIIGQTSLRINRKVDKSQGYSSFKDIVSPVCIWIKKKKTDVG